MQKQRLESDQAVNVCMLIPGGAIVMALSVISSFRGAGSLLPFAFRYC